MRRIFGTIPIESRGRIIIIAILFLVSFKPILFAQSTTQGHATIIFVDKEGERAKTYIGKLRKGDLQSLKYELQRYKTAPTITNTAPDPNKTRNEIADNVISSPRILTPAQSNKKAHDDLFANYEVNDEKSLKKVKEKKIKDREKTKKLPKAKQKVVKIKEPPKQYRKKKKSELSDYFKISKRRVIDGQKIAQPAGAGYIIVSWDVKEEGYIKTYVNVVEEYLKDGSKYYLKYHGTGSKRNYYLEFIPDYKK